MGIFSGIKKVAKGVGSVFSKASDFITGGAGDLIGAGISFLGGERANSANSAQAAQAMEFSKDSYQNRYQWTMNDMKKAGMNPIFAYQNGVGTGLPGAQATMQNTAASAIDARNSMALVNLSKKRLQSEIYKNTMAGDLSSAQDTLFRQSHRQNEELFPQTLAQNIATTNALKAQSAVQVRDAKFQLDHSELMKTKAYSDLVKNVLGAMPIIGKTIK